MTKTIAHIMLCLLALMTALPVSAQGTGGKPDYQAADSARVMALFRKAATMKQKDMPSYMLFFARQLKGVPYVAKTLEHNKTERLVVNLRQLDCTTYVETVLALSRCMRQGKATFANYCDQLRLIRYEGGTVAYTARKHYFTYWIDQSQKQGLVALVKSPNPPFSAVQTVKANYMTTHLAQYPMLDGRADRVAKVKAMEDAITGLKQRYIPKASLDNSALLHNTVHDGDILALVTTKQGLEISHVGIAVWHKDGLHLLNASSIHHKVVEDPDLLKTYLGKRQSAKGIRVVRPL